MLRGRVSELPASPVYIAPPTPELESSAPAVTGILIPASTDLYVPSVWLCFFIMSSCHASKDLPGSTPRPLSHPRINSPRRSGNLPEGYAAAKNGYIALSKVAPLQISHPKGAVAKGHGCGMPTGAMSVPFITKLPLCRNSSHAVLSPPLISKPIYDLLPTISVNLIFPYCINRPST